MPVEMIKVISSNLSHIGYEPAEKMIYVTFKNGGKTWKYGLARSASMISTRRRMAWAAISTIL